MNLKRDFCKADVNVSGAGGDFGIQGRRHCLVCSLQKNITVTGILDVKSAILFGQSVVSLMGVFRCKIVSVVKCKELQLQRFRLRSFVGYTKNKQYWSSLQEMSHSASAAWQCFQMSVECEL